MVSSMSRIAQQDYQLIIIEVVMIASVRGAVALMRCFTVQESELSVTELSQRLATHKSTNSRLLATLCAEGLVDRNPATGKYHLGMGLLELGGLVVWHADLRQIARPLLRQLSVDTQETVNMAILDRNESLNTEQVVSHNRHISGFGWVGRKTPLHASSTGKVLLAYLPKGDRKMSLNLPLKQFTENTITDLKDLWEELELVLSRGYATGLEELVVGLNAVAAPVRDTTGEVFAAVSVTGPSPRLSKQRIITEIAANAISCGSQIYQDLGYVVTS